MNILITGIHGFVGTNLVEALKDIHTIYGLDIISPLKDGIEYTFSWNELDKLPNIDAVIHLAGKAHDTKNKTASQVYFDINLGLTQKIYDWFLNSSAKKFIFFSSVKAAADVVKGEVLTEDIVPTPKGPYGESKIAAEKYINSIFQISDSISGNGLSSIQNSDKKNYIFRPCMIHGPGNKGNLNLLYNVVKKGIPYPLGAFENRRSFTSIDNLSFIIGQLLTSDIPSGIYNMADDETLSTNELIRLISDVMNKRPKIWNCPVALMNACAKLGAVLHLPLNEERLQKLTENYVVSNKKIKEALGIEKMPVTAYEGFRKTIRSFEGN